MTGLISLGTISQVGDFLQRNFIANPRTFPPARIHLDSRTDIYQTSPVLRFPHFFIIDLTTVLSSDSFSLVVGGAGGGGACPSEQDGDYSDEQEFKLDMLQ